LSEADRSLLLEVRERLVAILERYGSSTGNFGLIHADLHFGNLLLTSRGLGVIDFDDAAFGWFVYDLAVALMEHQADPDFPALTAALLRGYRSERPLDRRDEAMLPVFLLLRGTASIGWFHQRPEHADSEEFSQTLEIVLTNGRELVDERRT
jgi:Ser/Thr protein kinase RdoA (MazF antagonist)